MPKLQRIIETALYVDDLDRAATFYKDVMGVEPMSKIAGRLYAYDVGGASVLLLFKRGGSTEPSEMAGGVLPPHDGAGPLHMAFAIALEDLDAWETHLRDHGIEIEGRMVWERGGTSLYFRDPDGHMLEVATPGLWANY